MNLTTIGKKIGRYPYEILLIIIIGFHYVAILHTNSFLDGVSPNDLVDMSMNTIQTAALKSANLPVFYLFEFLVKVLYLSDTIIKALIALFCLLVISLSVYRICILLFKSGLSGILAVVLFLYSSLFFAPLFSNMNFIDDSNPDALSFAFLILGILLWVRQRYVLSSLFFGFSFDCHPILPIGCITAFLVYQLVHIRTVKIRTLAFSVLTFLITTLPVTWSILRSMMALRMFSSTLLDKELVWKYIAFAQPQSAFLDIIPGFHYGIALYFSSMLMLLIFINYSDGGLRRRYCAVFSIILTVFVLTIFEIVNSRYLRMVSLYNLWLHRFLSYGSLMNYVVLAGGCFCILNKKLVNRILCMCLFFLLVYSVFSSKLSLNVYATYWANHFYILELTIIYFIYNLFIFIRDLRPKQATLTVDLSFLMSSIIYFFYLSTYDRFKPADQITGLFQWGNVLTFLKMVLYKQFLYPLIHGFQNGFYILLLCMAILAGVALIVWIRERAKPLSEIVK